MHRIVTGCTGLQGANATAKCCLDFGESNQDSFATAGMRGPAATRAGVISAAWYERRSERSSFSTSAFSLIAFGSAFLKSSSECRFHRPCRFINQVA